MDYVKILLWNSGILDVNSFPLLPKSLYWHSDHAGSESRMEFRDPKDNIKEIKVENWNMKSESRELPQTAKSDKYEGRADESKESKH
ncbi:hypothetical protein C2S53_005577 [Perilla frutescens var. hirtella]|uniref:Uncharacterized protein n=1 Tax=Perilla frutescens var. hirtella TaxID=608512 RepID=A0AAD4JEB6_PERFH|nr:hypothetical protein C2S53_005577 [Perilla frutescens var. hirtella]